MRIASAFPAATPVAFLLIDSFRLVAPTLLPVGVLHGDLTAGENAYRYRSRNELLGACWRARHKRHCRVDQIGNRPNTIATLVATIPAKTLSATASSVSRGSTQERARAPTATRRMHAAPKGVRRGMSAPISATEAKAIPASQASSGTSDPSTRCRPDNLCGGFHEGTRVRRCRATRGGCFLRVGRSRLPQGRCRWWYRRSHGRPWCSWSSGWLCCRCFASGECHGASSL